MILSNPPEIFDGGYWCVVIPVVVNGKHYTVGDIGVTAWSAWYSEDMTKAVIRTLTPVIKVKTLTEKIDQVIAGKKPKDRIRGR